MTPDQLFEILLPFVKSPTQLELSSSGVLLDEVYFIDIKDYDGLPAWFVSKVRYEKDRLLCDPLVSFQSFEHVIAFVRKETCWYV